MSIELSNGVILPDVPAYDTQKNEYPYYAIFNCHTNTDGYVFLSSKAPFIHVPAGTKAACYNWPDDTIRIAGNESTNSRGGLSLILNDETQTWDATYHNNGDLINSAFYAIVSELVRPDELVYANHDVLTATYIDSLWETFEYSAEPYFRNSLGGSTMEEKKYLGVAGVQQLIANTRAEISTAEQNAKTYAKDYADGLADNYDAAGTAATKVQELADGQVKTNTEHIGTMDNLETTAKADLVTAINEVRNAVSAGGTAAAISMEEQTTGLGEGIAKAYVLKQGDNTVGTINIPKDMVVQSGEVVVDPEGQAAGTYIKLVLANATNDVIYVNVGTLVDIYKAKADATQVQLTIDSATREISAVIVAGSITATELAADAVTTVKIADGNVTKAKLSTEVQASLDKADVAETNAKAYTDEKDTAMDTRMKAVEAQLGTGEGSVDEKIATAKQEAIDAAASAADTKDAQVLADAKAYADEKAAANKGLIDTNTADIDKLEASLAEGGATANAIAEAKKAGTDAQAAVTALEEGTVATNTADIATLREDVDGILSVSYVEITADEIDAMFAN